MERDIQIQYDNSSNEIDSVISKPNTENENNLNLLKIGYVPQNSKRSKYENSKKLNSTKNYPEYIIK